MQVIKFNIRNEAEHASVTIKLNYEEVRDIANILYESKEKLDTQSRQQLRIDFSMLFPLLKEGFFDYFHCKQATQLYEAMEGTSDEKEMIESAMNKGE